MNCAAAIATAPPPAAIGGHAARGAFWTILFSAGSKLVTLGSQIALAWLLLPRELGLVALALSITCLASPLSASVLQRILIQRQRSADDEVGQAFWLALVMNVSGALVLLAASPVAALLFKEPSVAPLVLVIAVALPLQALPTIYAAALYRRLEFRSVAMIQFAQGILQNVSAVTLATLGCGAYSLVWPMVGSALFAAVAFRQATGRLAIGRPQPRLWLALLAPAVWLMAYALFTALQTAGSNFVIGLAHDSRVSGIYYWGFLVSSQAIFLVATNLQGVLFPVLCKINPDSERQYRAFAQACRTLMLVIVPVCVLQILLARPLIELVFHDRWLPAVPVVQWLSLGLLTQPLSILTASLLLARGQYRQLALVTAGVALAVTGAAAFGAQSGGADGIARYTGLTLLLANALAGWVGYRQFQRGWCALLATIIPPLALGLPILAGGWWLAGATVGNGLLFQAAALATFSLGGFALLGKLFFPRAVVELLTHLRSRPETSPQDLPPPS